MSNTEEKTFDMRTYQKEYIKRIKKDPETYNQWLKYKLEYTHKTVILCEYCDRSYKYHTIFNHINNMKHKINKMNYLQSLKAKGGHIVYPVHCKDSRKRSDHLLNETKKACLLSDVLNDPQKEIIN